MLVQNLTLLMLCKVGWASRTLVFVIILSLLTIVIVTGLF